MRCGVMHTCAPKPEVARSAIYLKAMLPCQHLNSFTGDLRNRWVA